MSFTQKYNRRQFQNILASGQGDQLYDIIEALEGRVEALVSLVNGKVVANTPASNGSSHEVPNSAHKLDRPDPTDLASALAVANLIKAAYNLHIVDERGTGTGAHLAADATNDVTAADATDEPTLVTLVTELQADYAAHIIDDATAHANADASNGLASAVAPTTTAECITVLKDLKAKYNAHIDNADGISSGVGFYDSKLV